MTDFWDKLPIIELKSEADVELRLVEPLLRAIGYEDDDIGTKYPVVFQEGRTGRRHEADYACFAGPLKNRDTSLLVVEAKKPTETLPPGKAQGESYAANLRAPVLVLTNGKTFEIWQLQAIQESVCVLSIPVSSLLKERGHIEQLIGKAALVEYCRSLRFKSLLEASADYGTYEIAELRRTARHGPSIERTLLHAGADRREDRIETSRLIEDFPGGATIVAPSGYGKTTLATRLFREAIEARWRKKQGPLAFDMSLPDLVQLQHQIPQFLQARLVAHCPGVSMPVLEQILRDTGATLFCDSFDRVAASARPQLDAQLSAFIRDYPKVQVFVFSRQTSKPTAPLSLLELESLTDEQMQAMERLILDEKDRHYSILGLMPQMLRSLCRNPLLLERALAFWKIHRSFPTQIRDLFEVWLSTVLKTEPDDAVSAFEREQGLSIIARATWNAPVAGEKASGLLNEKGLRREVLNDLANCDAIRFAGSVVEVQHEAMADYLRAKYAVSAEEEEILERLGSLPIAEDSFFPALLMAMLPTNRLQSELWCRLSATSIQAYGDALRYRFDLTTEMKKLEPEKLSHDYLIDLLDGVEMPLDGIFPAMRHAIAEELVGDPNGEFAATGLLSTDHSQISYMLHSRSGSSDSPRVKVALPDGPGTYRGVNLDMSQVRLDSGRLLGAKLLSDTVLKLVEQQEVGGSSVWAAERLVGRVRYLRDQYGFPLALDASLDALETLLKPHNGEWVNSGGFFGNLSFSIQSLLDDIAILRTASVLALDPWWLRLGWDEAAASQDEDVIIRVLNEHYRRVQLAYAEVIGTTFPKLAKQMGFYTVLPLRWDTTVVRRKPPSGGAVVFYRMLPVASWNEAGADIRFSDHGSMAPNFEEFRKAMVKLNRGTAEFYGQTGFKELPNFGGRQWSGRLDGATTVVHEVCSMLKQELEGLFSAIPHHDGVN